MDIARYAAVALLLAGISHAQKTRDIRAGRLYSTIPHVVDGASWKTTITLVNLESATRKYRLVLRGDNGALRSFPFVGRSPGNTFNGEIPPGGIAVFETPGTAPQLSSGWAELDALGTDSTVGIFAVFGTTGIPGRPDFEATVHGEFSLQYDGIMPYDNTRGYVTSIAVCNPSEFSTSSVPYTIYDENGAVLKRDSLALQRGNKVAFATPERWPETAGKRGTIHFQGQLTYWSVLGFRFHPGGAFTTFGILEP